MKIETKVTLPSNDFSEDFIFHFGSVFYFLFDGFIEAFPINNFPSKHEHVYDMNENVNRREMLKSFSDYHRAANHLIQFVRKNESR